MRQSSIHSRLCSVLCAATLILTVLPGRVTVLQGAIHLSIFATFLFLAISP